MQGKAICVLLLAFAGLCACSREENQKTLARRFSGADSAIMTNAIGQSLSLTAEDARKVIEGVSTARQVKGDPACSPNLWFGFFTGTNFLGGFNACSKLFWVDLGLHPGGWRRVAPYIDTTGTFE